MLTETKNHAIYRLLRIRIINPLFLFLIYPPIYAIWLYAIGKFLLGPREKEFKTFKIFAVGTIIFCIFFYLIVPILYFTNIAPLNNYEVINETLMPFMSMGFCVFWFGTLGMIAKMTVDYERLLTSDTTSSPIDFITYFRRFFLLFWWYVGLWFIQPKVNKYLTSQTANDSVT